MPSAAVADPKLPPRALDAEAAVCGCVLLNSRSLAQIIPIIGTADEMFTDTELSRLYVGAVQLYDAGKPIDPVTLAGRLGANFDPSLYAHCQAAVPTSANAEHYAAVMRDAWAARQMQTAAKQLYHGAGRDWKNWRGMLGEHLRALESVTRRDTTAGIHRLDAVFESVLEHLEQIAAGKHASGQIPLGYSAIDALLVGGLMPGDLCILAARPKLGKSATCLNVCENAIKNNVPTCLITLEMSVTALTERLMGIMASADTKRIRTGWNAQTELDKIRRLDRTPMALMTICDPRSSKLADVLALLKNYHEKHGPGLFVIDYLQLICGYDRDRRSRNEIVGDVTRNLKQLAGQTDSPILLLSQLNRQAEKESDPFRLLSHLRESGAIEQDADSILFLTQPKTEEREKAGHRFGIHPDNVVLLTLGANRRGAIGHCYCSFDRDLQRITEPGQNTPAPTPPAYYGGVTGERYEEDQDDMAF